MRDLEQEHEKLPSTMSLKKSIDMDPGFSFSGDTKTLSCGSEKGNNTLGKHSLILTWFLSKCSYIKSTAKPPLGTCTTCETLETQHQHGMLENNFFFSRKYQ